MPFLASSGAVKLPMATTTVSAAIRPLSVMTACTRPPLVSIFCTVSPNRHCTPRAAQAAASALGELVAIADLVAGEIEGAGQRGFRARQGRLELHAAVGVDPLVEQPVPREKGGGALGAVQRFAGPVDLEHAAGGAVIGDSGFGADLLQGLQRMKRQMEVGLGVLAKSLRGAVAGEFDAPAQDMRYGAVAQEQRRILLGPAI